MTVFSAAVLAPLVEELVFRGAIFRKWRVRWGPGKAALLSSLLFAAVHLQASPGKLVLALTCVLVYTSTRSLWAAVLLHAMHNAGLYVLAGRYSWGGFQLRLDAPWKFVLLGLVLLAGVGVWLRFVIQNWRTLAVPLPPDSLEPAPAASAARLPEPTRAGG